MLGSIGCGGSRVSALGVLGRIPGPCCVVPGLGAALAQPGGQRRGHCWLSLASKVAAVAVDQLGCCRALAPSLHNISVPPSKHLSVCLSVCLSRRANAIG